LFKDAGYATAIFGKWHLGIEPQSLPGAHGFDEFYGIPPNTSWDDAVTVPLIMQTHSVDAPEQYLIEKGPWIMAQKAGGPLEKVKPFTPEVRAEIDNELTDRSIAFIKQQAAASKPFFLYLPFSMGHAPNYPSKQFAGRSRIGQYGDKMMEGDYHVGQVLDTLKELKLDDNTIVAFASDNGPWGWSGKAFGNLGSPDMGSPGPFRGQLGEATEGSIRTFAFIRCPGARSAEHHLLRHVLDHGFPSDLRGNPRSDAAYGSSNRRCGPDSSAPRHERGGSTRVPAHVRRP
jgi:arylsulfatase